MPNFFTTEQKRSSQLFKDAATKNSQEVQVNKRLEEIRDENVLIAWLKQVSTLLMKPLTVRVSNYGDLLRKLDEVKKSLNMPTPIFHFVPKDIQEVKVNNFPEKKEIQKVEIQNPKAFPKELGVRVLNWQFPKIDYPKFPEIKWPDLQRVAGGVAITNWDKMKSLDIQFPKVQEVTGKVDIVNFAHLTKGLQAIIDKLGDVENGLELARKEATVVTAVASSPTAIKSTGRRQITGLTKFDPNDSAPIYVGTHDAPDASDTDTKWQIIKYTYSGSNVTQIQRKNGAWSKRTTLF